jgi:ElaB/YqjD/DUF883 family membrane-anchored ribosome-binding protein
MENHNDPNRRFDPDPPASSAIPVDWDQLKARFQQWRDEIMQTLQAKLESGEINTEEFKTRADDALRMAQERWKDFEQNYGDYAKRLTQKIEKHPIASAAIALGVGFLAANLLRRK